MENTTMTISCGWQSFPAPVTSFRLKSGSQDLIGTGQIRLYGMR